MQSRDDFSKDWFCRCCVNYFKRDNPTFINNKSEHYQQYLFTGMCDVCMKEVNEKDIEEQLNELKNNYKEDDNIPKIIKRIL